MSTDLDYNLFNETLNMKCSACDTGKKFTFAVKYCVECMEYLCDPCSHMHTKGPFINHHVLDISDFRSVESHDFLPLPNCLPISIEDDNEIDEKGTLKTTESYIAGPYNLDPSIRFRHLIDCTPIVDMTARIKTQTIAKPEIYKKKTTMEEFKGEKERKVKASPVKKVESVRAFLPKFETLLDDMEEHTIQSSSIKEMILNENVVNTCLDLLKKYIEDKRNAITIMDIHLNTASTENKLYESVNFSSLRSLKKLSISHATDNEILTLSKFERSLSRIKYLHIHGPERDNNTSPLKLSTTSLAILLHHVVRLESLSLRNMLIAHYELFQLFTFIEKSEYLRELTLSNITCKDHFEMCPRFDIDLQQAECLSTIDLSGHKIPHLSCQARYLDKPVTVMADSVTRLSLNVQYEQIFRNAFVEQLKLLIGKNLSLETVDLQGIIIGRNEIPSIKLCKTDLQNLMDLENNETNYIQFFTKLIGGQIDFKETHFDMFDFQIGCGLKHTYTDSVILNFVCYELAKAYPEEVLEAYASSTKDTIPSLVCILKSNIPILEFRRFCLNKRQILGTNSKSPIKAENSVDKNSEKYKQAVETTFEDLNVTLGYHTKQLMLNHSNLEAARVSFVKVRNNDEGEICPCVVIYCKVKSAVPYKEKHFPKKLKHPDKDIEFPTDIREGNFSFCPLTTHGGEWNKKLAMGCSIGEYGVNVGATIGPFVNVVETGVTCFLTVRHTFSPLTRPDRDIIGVKVVQPSDVYVSQHQLAENKECGKVLVCQLGEQIDAALVEISQKRLPSKGNFANIFGPDLQFAGFGLGDLPKYEDGSCIDAKLLRVPNLATRRIIKVGSASNLTKGTLTTTDGCVRETCQYTTLEHTFNGQPEKLKLMSQLFVDSYYKFPFCRGGDSGAAVFLANDDNTLHCIGMLVGMLDDSTAVVTPIQNILDILGHKYGKKLELKKFNTTPMDTSQ